MFRSPSSKDIFRVKEQSSEDLKAYYLNKHKTKPAVTVKTTYVNKIETVHKNDKAYEENKETLPEWTYQDNHMLDYSSDEYDEYSDSEFSYSTYDENIYTIEKDDIKSFLIECHRFEGDLLDEAVNRIEDNSKCGVCWSLVREEGVTILCDKKHICHQDCINNWLNHCLLLFKCPTCNMQLTRNKMKGGTELRERIAKVVQELLPPPKKDKKDRDK